MPPRRTPSETIDRAIEIIRSGKTMREAAAEVGVRPNTLSHHLTDRGLSVAAIRGKALPSWRCQYCGELGALRPNGACDRPECRSQRRQRLRQSNKLVSAEIARRYVQRIYQPQHPEDPSDRKREKILVYVSHTERERVADYCRLRGQSMSYLIVSLLRENGVLPPLE